MYVMHNNKPGHCYYATKLQKDDKFDPSGKKLLLNMFSVLSLVILGYHFFFYSLTFSDYIIQNILYHH
jgi:hypothetical protein